MRHLRFRSPHPSPESQEISRSDLPATELGVWVLPPLMDPEDPEEELSPRHRERLHSFIARDGIRKHLEYMDAKKAEDKARATDTAQDITRETFEH